MTRKSAITSCARRTLLTAMAALIAGCSTSPGSNRAQAELSSTRDATITSPSPSPSPSPEPPSGIKLRDFAAFPTQAFRKPVSDSLQAVLEDAVEAGTIRGISAGVVVGDAGHWSGAAGADLDGNGLAPNSRALIGSIGKTVTAAQVLRLVEEGAIGLDDPAADYLPPELDGYDANGATVREMLGMRSGIADPSGYIASVDAGATIPELVEMLSEPRFAPGSDFEYANMNYVLLGSIIEHMTGRSLWKVLRSDVLHHPGLGGVRYPVHDALAGDGWQIESDPASLMRWGYELYGGSLLSAASLRAMIDFEGEFYGLGVIDLSGENPATGDGFGEPAIGHTGREPGVTTMLVAFPRTGEVVSVQTHSYGGHHGENKMVIEELLAAVRGR